MTNIFLTKKEFPSQGASEREKSVKTYDEDLRGFALGLYVIFFL